MADFASPEASPTPVQGWILGLDENQVIALGLNPATNPISVAGVAQFAMNAVDVGYTHEPFAFNPFASNDALNLNNYTLSPPDRLLQNVEKVGPGVVRLFYDGALTAATTYTVTASNVEGPSLALVPPTSGDFVAFEISLQSTSQNIAERGQRRDLRNTGTLSLESTGDFANEEGLAYVKKRILRRATTVLGGFALLPGYGFAEPLKALITGDLQRRIASRAQSQVLLEPDVVSANVTVTASSLGILSVSIQAETDLGVVDVSFRAVLQDGNVEIEF